MIRDIYASVTDYQILGAISVCLFFAIFSFRLFLSFNLKKEHLEEMGALPLDLKPTGNGD